jgi:hypothetical protein
MAGENWTDAAQGTFISFSTTANLGVVTSEKMRLWGDGGLQLGGAFTASPGAGGLGLNGINIAVTPAANTTVNWTPVTADSFPEIRYFPSGASTRSSHELSVSSNKANYGRLLSLAYGATAIIATDRVGTGTSPAMVFRSSATDWTAGLDAMVISPGGNVAFNYGSSVAPAAPIVPTHPFQVGTNAAIRLAVNSAGVVLAPTNTAATSKTTGCLVTTGGIGSSGAVWCTQAVVDNGSASAPGFRFSSDTQTGFYRQGSNTIGVSHANTERARLGAADYYFSPTSASHFGGTVGTAINISDPGLNTARLRVIVSTTTDAQVHVANFGRADLSANSPTSIGVYGYGRGTGGSGTMVGVQGSAVYTSAGGTGASTCIGGRFIASSAITTAGKYSFGVSVSCTATGASNASSIRGIFGSTDGAASSASVIGYLNHVTVPSAFTGTQLKAIESNIIMASGTASTTAAIHGNHLVMTVNQGGTAAYDGYCIEVTETAVGTGDKHLFCGAVGAVDQFYVTNAGVTFTKTFYAVGTQEVTASATINSGRVKFTGSTASQTLTLPVVVAGTEVKIRNSASVTVTVAAGSGSTIEGASSVVLNAGESLALTLVGTDWTGF